MNFEASRTFAEKKLNSFIDNNLNEYSKLRNFDFGPNKRSNISCISPYVTHGVINEIEIIKKSLKKYSFFKNEKFIQEVLWRVYWKTNKKLKEGYLFGIFMIALWSIRLVIEFLKEPQVDGREDWVFNSLNTGQVLSIPLILIGIWLMLRKQKQTA